jgi:signal transduction histidine kinase
VPIEDSALPQNPAPTGPGHVVQFYEGDAELCRVLTDFAAAGLEAGEAVIVIAEAPHREELAGRMRERGFDVEQAVGAGHLVLLDARETLATFMVGGMPSWDRFATGLRDLLARAAAAGRRARVYGEMVDLLWREGNQRAAIRLEEMGNELGRTGPTAILCGYSMDGFVKASDAAGFDRICEVHTDVGPIGDDLAASPDAGASPRELAQLRQRVRALEAEVQHRQRLEVVLRQALEALRAGHDAKDQLIAKLGHELRNPLGTIVLALDLMAAQGNMAGRERAIVAREVQQLVQLVDNLTRVV